MLQWTQLSNSVLRHAMLCYMLGLVRPLPIIERKEIYLYLVIWRVKGKNYFFGLQSPQCKMEENSCSFCSLSSYRVCANFLSDSLSLVQSWDCWFCFYLLAKQAQTCFSLLNSMKRSSVCLYLQVTPSPVESSRAKRLHQEACCFYGLVVVLNLAGQTQQCV